MGFSAEEILESFASADEPELCEHSELFLAWSGALCDAAIKKGRLVVLHQAKLLLTDRYMVWRDNVPRAHQRRDVEFQDDGHACIFSVFAPAYQRLREAEVALDPPKFSDSPGPRIVRPRRSPVDGFTIGEYEDDEFEDVL